MVMVIRVCSFQTQYSFQLKVIFKVEIEYPDKSYLSVWVGSENCFRTDQGLNFISITNTYQISFED